MIRSSLKNCRARSDSRWTTRPDLSFTVSGSGSSLSISFAMMWPPGLLIGGVFEGGQGVEPRSDQARLLPETRLDRGRFRPALSDGGAVDDAADGPTRQRVAGLVLVAHHGAAGVVEQQA